MGLRMHALVVLLGAVLLVSPALSLEDRPRARTALGTLVGTWLTSEKGEKYAGFMTVPFAKPPLGELRFEPPQKMEAWSGEWDAGSPSPLCLTYDHLMNPMDKMKVKGQEDCLFLNVYTPKVEAGANMDVLVYIHAGAFMFGTSSIYGGKLLMDRPVVLVVINYRLGPLGFMSLEDDVHPGNNGMRDQVMALEWIRDHISNFGGNPGSVTIVGMSAGGSSVHYHYLSPLSRGLFQRGVSQSGTALSPWALAEGSREKALQLAVSLGCPVDQGSAEILRCMRQRPAESIVARVEQFQVWKYSPFSPFGPVVESQSQSLPPFLPDSPISLLQRGEVSREPWITGVMEYEGLYPGATFIADPEEMRRLDREFDDLVPHLLDFNRTVVPQKRAEVLASIRKEYFGAEEIDDDMVSQVLKMISDRLFVDSAQQAVQLQAKLSFAYFYHFTYRGKHSLSDMITASSRNYGASHADDISYWMNVSYIPHEEPRQGTEMEVQTMMMDLWTTFARDGVPKSELSVPWEQVTPSGSLKYLSIESVPPVMKSTDDLGNARFWDSLPILEAPQRVSQSPVRNEL